MANLNNPIEKFLENQEYQTKVHKAIERFQFKPFYKRFELIKKCCDFNYLFHAFSILTGLTFLAFLIESMLHNFWVSLIVAAIGLSFWELAKSRLMTTAFDLYYGSKSVPILLTVISACVIAGSIYASLEGTKIYYQLNDQLVNSIESQYQIKKDSIIQYYDKAIASETKSLESYKKAVSWRGQINMSNKTTKQVIAAHTSAISELKADKRITLAQAHTNHIKSKNATVQNSEFNQNRFLVLAGINETLILIMTWFLVFYDYKTAAEDQKLTGLNPVLTFDSQSLKQLVELIKGKSENEWGLALNEAKSKQLHLQTKDQDNTIGFRLNSNPPNSKPQTQFTKLKNYLAKYDYVVEAINAGLSEKKVLAKTKVKRSTYYNVKRCLKNINSAVPQTS